MCVFFLVQPKHLSCFGYILEFNPFCLQPILHVVAPLPDYISMLTWLGATTTVTMAPQQRPPTSANLIGEQTSCDEEWIRQQEVSVDIRELVRRYMKMAQEDEDPTEGEVPARGMPCMQCARTGGVLARRACSGHLFFTIPHRCMFLPPPHQTIWSTFSLCTQFMMMARVVGWK